MSFYLNSRKRLLGVHPDLAGIMDEIHDHCPIDFAVTSGVRTLDEEREMVKRGTSTTMNSRHLLQKDGLSHAVDLVPVREGKLSWTWPEIYIVARSVHFIATQQRVSLIWGGCWDRNFTDSQVDPRALSEDYVARRKKAGKRVFLDGPHFELAGT